MRNLKKVISSVAALAIVASTASAFAVNFPDVDASASYATAVESLTALGVVNGDDGLFKPDNSVTRAEFTKMAVEALGEGSAATSQTTSKFNDAANTTVHWAAGYIAQGVSDGFIDGYDDTTFGPEDKVTYAQACKMLVAAIGYTQYAESQGGYPAGYVAQANTLGITKGVSSNNDKELTRAECAMLIYNAMDVPLCVVDYYDSDFNYMTGEQISKPVYKKLDGKEQRDYQTLLTYKHDTYKVKGRVIQNSVGTDLDKDEVRFQTEVADNLFDDVKNYKADSPLAADKKEVKVGTTKAADMLFEYAEALIQYDEDADEYTILSITQYGTSKVVEFAADDLADDDKVIETNYIENGKLPVYKSENSSSTTKYDLEEKAVIYVNGVEVGELSDAYINDYILNNATGTVKLIDATEAGSTSTNGKYDYVMVSYYVDAVVDSVQTTSTYAKIYFKENDTNVKNAIKWDPEDENVNITFTKDGKAIDYTELAEYDVLSIAYNVEDVDWNNLEYADILVASNTVTGTATSRDEDENTVRVDGADYEVVDRIEVKDAFELSTEYTLYLDAFGYVSYVGEGNSDKNYGVIVAMYTSAGNDEPTVRMITSDAQVVAYECKDRKEANSFYNYATKTTDGYKNPGFTKSEISANIKAGATVCEYRLSGGKAKFYKEYKPVNEGKGSDLEYRASSTKLGGYTLAEGTTKIIDMDEYMSESNSGSTVGTLSVSSFEDEATYDAYLFDKNNNGDYRFAIVFSGTSSIRPETQIAVVVKNAGTTTFADQDNLNEIYIAKDGKYDESEPTIVYSEESVNEGDVIAYVTNTDGYVETGDMYVLMSAGDSYETMLTAAIDAGDTSKLVDWTVKDGDKYAISYEDGKISKKDIYAYYGIVYKKSSNNLEVITNTTGGTSNINNVENLSVAGANEYVYDFGQKDKFRVSAGGQSQSTSLFNQSFTDGDKNIIGWDKVKENDVRPTLVFVKEVDKNVTDVIYFVAD